MVVGIKFLWISLGFHNASYAWCLRYNICSAWFLDITISTCLITGKMYYLSCLRIWFIYIIVGVCWHVYLKGFCANITLFHYISLSDFAWLACTDNNHK